MIPDEAMRGSIRHVITARTTEDKSESASLSGDSHHGWSPFLET